MRKNRRIPTPGRTRFDLTQLDFYGGMNVLNPRFFGLLGLASWLCLAPSAQAQKLEITPFVGYQFGGAFEDRFDFDNDDFDDLDLEESENFGLILDVALNQNVQLEFLYSRQETSFEPDSVFGRNAIDLEVDYLHVGALYQWVPGQFRPYVVASAGATRFSPEVLDRETRPSVSVGGGVKLFLGDHIGFRFEGRMYSTWIDDDDEVFCDDRYCFTYEDNVFLFQWDVKAGLIIAF